MVEKKKVGGQPGPREPTQKRRERAHDLFAKSAEDARLCLLEIMGNANAPAPARIAAAKEILDRAFGRAPQYHEVAGADDQPLNVRLELVDKLLGNLEASVRSKGD
jgi:hypothetical protein